MRRQALAGLTLLEVMVATALLGVALLTLAAVQLQALQVQGRLRELREVTRLVEGALDRQIAYPVAGEYPCAQELPLETGSAAGPECRVTVFPCSDEAAGEGRLCGESYSGRAYGIRVTAATETGEDGSSGNPARFEVSTVVARFLP